jgi:hypothetical protein
VSLWEEAIFIQLQEMPDHAIRKLIVAEIEGRGWMEGTNESVRSSRNKDNRISKSYKD